MGYYLRAFCTSQELPPLRTVLAFAESAGYPLTVSELFQDLVLDRQGWRRVELLCATDDSRFAVETDYDEGASDGLVRQEIAEFRRAIGPPLWYRNRRQVLEHLRQTKCIVSTQILHTESGNFGVGAANVFLAYFLRHCGGMLQADREGFYEGDQLLLKVNWFGDRDY